MKWHIMRYSTRVCTVWNDENSSTLSVLLEYKESIKETVAFTKALHYDLSYYHTAFSAETSYPSTEHMG